MQADRSFAAVDVPSGAAIGKYSLTGALAKVSNTEESGFEPGGDVTGPSIKQLTLREMFKDSDKLVRDLTEHLDRGFYPKARQLERLVRPTETEAFAAGVEDVTVRSHVKAVLDSEAYTDQLYQKLAEYCDAINDSVSRIVEGE